MFFNTLLLPLSQYIAAFICFAVLFLLSLSHVVYASPGAHGPNGEHLDTAEKAVASSNPKFESFTESFEILGELLESQLVIYLHDYKSNVPVAGASIELESGELSSSAKYSDMLKAYILTEQKMLELLNTEREHEIVITVMTEDNGDLLVANLDTTNLNTTNEQYAGQHDDSHDHMPWFEIVIALIVFSIGFLLGRFNLANMAKEKKS